jgi:hypothetical protein
MRIAMILLAAVGTVAVGAGGYFMFFFSLTGDTQSEIVMEQHSPNDAYIASVVNSFGGATVSNSTFVCIRLKGEQLKATSESIVFRVENIPKVGIKWNNYEQLIVDYDPEKVWYRTDGWRGVKVLYVEHRLSLN